MDDTEVVTVGFEVEPFRESVPLSSADFRPGEYLGSRDVSRRFSTWVSTLERRGLFVWSAADEVGTGGAPSSLPELREVGFASDPADC